MTDVMSLMKRGPSSHDKRVPLVAKLDLSLIYLRGVQLFVQFLHALSADARALTARSKGFLR